MIGEWWNQEFLDTEYDPTLAWVTRIFIGIWSLISVIVLISGNPAPLLGGVILFISLKPLLWAWLHGKDY